MTSGLKTSPTPLQFDRCEKKDLMASMSDVEEELGDQSDPELDVDESEELGEDEEIEDLDDDGVNDVDEDTRKELKVVEEVLSQKEQNARSLAIRRAIEQRMEDRQLHNDVDDLDYLDD